MKKGMGEKNNGIKFSDFKIVEKLAEKLPYELTGAQKRVIREIAKDIKENPEEVLKHPLNTPVKKVDEVLAARKLDLAYKTE